LHLNVPEHNKQHQQVYRKAVWLFIGLVAPEWIALTAYKQRLEAAAMQKQIDALFNRSDDPSRWTQISDRIQKWLGDRWSGFFGELDSDTDSTFPPVDQRRRLDWFNNISERYHGPLPWGSSREWTIVHSHYAVMGGFAIDTSTLSQKFLPDKRTRLTLTVDGFMYLLLIKPHLVSYVSEENIVDKSKASKFAKTIVCIQAAWFMVQCITRMSLHLPISLLELSTFVHALCTLVVYGLWWDKPLDIEVPTTIPIHDTDTQELVATMVMQSRIGREKDLRADKYPWLRFFFRAIIERAAPLSRNLELSRQPHGPSPYETSVTPSETTASFPSSFHEPQDEDLQSAITLPFHQNYQEHIVHDIRTRIGGFKIHVQSSSYNHLINFQKLLDSATVLLDSENQQCLRLAKSNWAIPPGELLAARIRNSPNIFGSLPKGDRYRSAFVEPLPLFIGFVLSGAVYGGIHLFGWTGQFPSHTQKLLWRISVISIGAPAVYLAGVTVVISIIFTISWICSKLRPYYNGVKSRLPGPISSSLLRRMPGLRGYATIIVSIIVLVLCAPILIALFFAIVGFIPLYVISRTYIVVESFITLFYVPDGVFDMPTWSEYFPHIG
jgi:hypothetical protein